MRQGAGRDGSTAVASEAAHVNPLPLDGLVGRLAKVLRKDSFGHLQLSAGVKDVTNPGADDKRVRLAADFAGSQLGSGQGERCNQITVDSVIEAYDGSGIVHLTLG